MQHAYAVLVTDRMDGLYLFSKPGDADRFLQAVIETGGHGQMTEEPISDTSGADELIAQELDE